MNRWITPEDWPTWRALFEGFTASAFRLEQLQTYDAPGENEAVERFIAGQPHGADTSWWTSLVRDHRKAGHTMSRVRVVTEPLTDYTRFELAVFPDLVAAGDEIRVLALDDDTPAFPHDYWLFDDRDLWRMHYTDGGAYQGAENIPDPDEVDRHRQWRDDALQRSVPLHDYLETRRTVS